MSTDGQRTVSMLRRYAAGGHEFRAEDALPALIAAGWDAGSRVNPLNTVRSNLAHMTESGILARAERGVYRLARDGDEPAAGTVTLAAMIADLEGFIERRAAELAAPAIEEAEQAINAVDQRIPDLQREWGRQREVLERRIARTERDLALARGEVPADDN